MPQRSLHMQQRSPARQLLPGLCTLMCLSQERWSCPEELFADHLYLLQADICWQCVGNCEAQLPWRSALDSADHSF